VSLRDNDDWESAWVDFTDAHARNPARLYRTRLVLAAIATAGGAARVVDFGCGPGILAREIARAFPAASIVGIDRSRTGLAHAAEHLPKARFFQVDLSAAPAPAEAASLTRWADIATCTEMLEHLDDPALALRNMSEYLKPEGRLIITVPSGPRSSFDRHIGHRRHYRAADLRALLEQEGYRVERIVSAGFPFFNLYKLVVIARGRSAVRDAEIKTSDPTASRWPLDVAYATFGALFRVNLERVPWGWQLLAVARPPVRAAVPEGP
jgi:2-polyprenyl-3-methyl-5-hydroxy-6-metoxy-1,4-benzoquinol methylase